MNLAQRFLRSPATQLAALLLWGAWFSWPFVTGTFADAPADGFRLLYVKWAVLVAVLLAASRVRPAHGEGGAAASDRYGERDV